MTITLSGPTSRCSDASAAPSTSDAPTSRPRDANSRAVSAPMPAAAPVMKIDFRRLIFRAPACRTSSVRRMLPGFTWRGTQAVRSSMTLAPSCAKADSAISSTSSQSPCCTGPIGLPRTARRRHCAGNCAVASAFTDGLPVARATSSAFGSGFASSASSCGVTGCGSAATMYTHGMDSTPPRLRLAPVSLMHDLTLTLKSGPCADVLEDPAYLVADSIAGVVGTSGPCGEIPLPSAPRRPSPSARRPRRWQALRSPGHPPRSTAARGARNMAATASTTRMLIISASCPA